MLKSRSNWHRTKQSLVKTIVDRIFAGCRTIVRRNPPAAQQFTTGVLCLALRRKTESVASPIAIYANLSLPRSIVHRAMSGSEIL